MDAAAYGVLGACLGAAVTGAVSVFTTRAQAQLRASELAQQDHAARRALAAEVRRDKAQRYAIFLSAFWQEERHVSEMLEKLSVRRPGWSESIRRTNSSAEHQKALDTLNESMGWISILCVSPEVERAAHALSSDFDRMMELFGTQLHLARNDDACDPACVGVALEELRESARRLSALLRADLAAPSVPEVPFRPAP